MHDTEKLPEQGDSTAATADSSGNAVSADGKGNGLSTNRKIWMGTAVGIGSAAIVAALLYTKHRKDKS